jgi:hypothetical protein
MQDLEWLTSTSTVGSKKVPVPVGLPPVSTFACRHGIGYVSLDDVALRRGAHGADVVAVVASVMSLA